MNNDRNEIIEFIKKHDAIFVELCMFILIYVCFLSADNCRFGDAFFHSVASFGAINFIILFGILWERFRIFKIIIGVLLVVVVIVLLIWNSYLRVRPSQIEFGYYKCFNDYYFYCGYWNKYDKENGMWEGCSEPLFSGFFYIGPYDDKMLKEEIIHYWDWKGNNYN